MCGLLFCIFVGLVLKRALEMLDLVTLGPGAAPLLCPTWKHTTLLVITGIICTPRNRKGPKPQATAVPRIFVCVSVSVLGECGVRGTGIMSQPHPAPLGSDGGSF